MPMIAYKRNKNIKDILVQSKLKNTIDTTTTTNERSVHNTNDAGAAEINKSQ